ncbi:MAG: hypothetical protein L0G33_06480 [Staphylococcus equorum]|nr:hypothetical protein [Staphylococcus equorum]
MRKQFLTSKDVQIILGRSKATANRRINQMNTELKEQGYYTERGLVPVTFFQEKYKGIEIPEELLEIY